MPKTSFTSAASISAMKACAIGGTVSVLCSRRKSENARYSNAGILIRAGMSMRLSSRSPAKTCYLWRAIDHEGEVLEAYVTKTRDKAAALKFLRKAMKRYGFSKVIVTDGLASYGAAMKAIGNQEKRDAGR